MNLPKYSPPVRRTGHSPNAFVTISKQPLSQSHPWIVSAPANRERAAGDWQRIGVALAAGFWEALALATECNLPLRLGDGLPIPPAGKTWRDVLGPRLAEWEVMP
jgi:hypothetical protein